MTNRRKGNHVAFAILLGFASSIGCTLSAGDAGMSSGKADKADKGKADKTALSAFATLDINPRSPPRYWCHKSDDQSDQTSCSIARERAEATGGSVQVIGGNQDTSLNTVISVTEVDGNHIAFNTDNHLLILQGDRKLIAKVNTDVHGFKMDFRRVVLEGAPKPWRRLTNRASFNRISARGESEDEVQRPPEVHASFSLEYDKSDAHLERLVFSPGILEAEVATDCRWSGPVYNCKRTEETWTYEFVDSESSSTASVFDKFFEVRLIPMRISTQIASHVQIDDFKKEGTGRGYKVKIVARVLPWTSCQPDCPARDDSR